MHTLERDTPVEALAELPFTQVVEARPDEATARSCAEAWVPEAHERLTSQLTELALLYRGRSVRETYHGSSHVDEFTTFATRTADCTQLEELYTIYDRYDARAKTYQTRSYIVTVLASDTSAGYRIIWDDHGMQLREPDEQGKEAIVYDDERIEELLADFFQRSLIATIRETDRQQQPQMAADMDALVQTIDRCYEGQYGREKRAAQAWLEAYARSDAN